MVKFVKGEACTRDTTNTYRQSRGIFSSRVDGVDLRQYREGVAISVLVERRSSTKGAVCRKFNKENMHTKN